MTQDPELDVLTKIAALGLGWTAGTNAFTGEVLPVSSLVPANALFVEAQPGERPDPYVGAASSVWPVEVEITVRSAPGDREAGRAQALALLRALHTVVITGYFSVLCEESVPEHLGEDEAQCHEYAFSVLLEWDA